MPEMNGFEFLIQYNNLQKDANNQTYLIHNIEFFSISHSFF